MPRASLSLALLWARIVETHQHPNADLLWCVTVDIGDRKLRIVHSGTRELHPGDLVPVAPPGSAIQRPDGTYRRMRTRSYRGQRSEGMLCSSDELGWTEGGPDAVHLLGSGEPGGAPCIPRDVTRQ